MKARLAIRPGVYRSANGYKIYGKDSAGRIIKVFTLTRTSAEHIRDVIRKGGRICVADFTFGEKEGQPEESMKTENEDKRPVRIFKVTMSEVYTRVIAHTKEEAEKFAKSGAYGPSSQEWKVLEIEDYDE